MGARGGPQPPKGRELVIVDLTHATMMTRFGMIGSAGLERTGRGIWFLGGGHASYERVGH